jgi:hypothetical protein
MAKCSTAPLGKARWRARGGLGARGVAFGKVVAHLDQGQVGGVQQAFHLACLGVGHLHGARAGQLQGFIAQIFMRGVQPPEVQRHQQQRCQRQGHGPAAHAGRVWGQQQLAHEPSPLHAWP